MIIAGLTGGMACGKSFVARAFAQLGAFVLEADDLGREVMTPGGDAYDAVMAAFGTVDRAVLAARVFNDAQELAKLNAIVHPAVRKLALKRMAEADAKVGIYVAAILLESGAYRDVGKIIVVTCSREQQIARAIARGGKEADVMARLSRQMPLDEKKARADYVIDASGTEDETLRQTKLVWEDLIRQA